MEFLAKARAPPERWPRESHLIGIVHTECSYSNVHICRKFKSFSGKILITPVFWTNAEDTSHILKRPNRLKTFSGGKFAQCQERSPGTEAVTEIFGEV